MSKGKYQRKREHARQNAKKQITNVALSNGKVTPAEKQEETTNPSHSNRRHEKENSVSFREAVKRSSFTDWCIAAFTLVLTVVAIYQLIVTGGQLDTMRKDQRPWLKIINATPDNIVLTEGQTALGSIQVLNSGKTPAKDVHLEVTMQKLRSDEIPSPDWGRPHVIASTGTVFPNVTSKPLAFGLGKEEINASGFTAITQDDVQQFDTGKVYFVVYGKAIYTDFFGTDHWTHFCVYRVNGNIDVSVPARPCTQYNDVDNN